MHELVNGLGKVSQWARKSAYFSGLVSIDTPDPGLVIGCCE